MIKIGLAPHKQYICAQQLYMYMYILLIIIIIMGMSILGQQVYGQCFVNYEYAT